MTVAVIDDDFGLKVLSGSKARVFFDDFVNFCGGKGCHNGMREWGYSSSGGRMAQYVGQMFPGPILKASLFFSDGRSLREQFRLLIAGDPRHLSFNLDMPPKGEFLE